MCGITGFSGYPNESILKRMMDSIVHRGPDDDGYYSDGKINLGMRRLSILDIQSGKQPIHNENKRFWTVFNGEIYNYKELRESVQARGHQFYTHHSDTELIVHLYEDYGLDFPNYFNGMFAIALWDSLEEKLILIRDRMGVKPLFYTLTGEQIIFGSEIKTILAHPAYKREMNYDALYHYLSLRNIPAPMTAFKDIYSLLPGEMLIYCKGKITRKKWWKLDYKKEKNTDEVYIKSKILELLEDATRLRMRCDAPFGAYLSGGVDSSSVVALMTRFSDKPIKTFALGYEDEMQNKEADLFHARRVHEFFKTEHREYIMSSKELPEDAENVIKAFDQPFSGTISTYFLTKLISKHVKVALSGDGADELFGSYLSHRTAMPLFYFKELYKKIKENNLSEFEKKKFLPCDMSYLENLYDKSGGNEEKWRYALYLFPDKEKENLLSSRFKSNTQIADSFALVKDYFSELTAEDPLNRILEMELKSQFPDQVLAFVDFLSMAHSVEVRSPFIDYRLVEFAATIPGDLKIKNGVVKDILKKSVEPVLPEGIIDRPKEGFVLPIYDWMVEKLRPFSEDCLSETRLKRTDLLEPEAVQTILRDHYTGNRKNPAKIWTLINLQLWSEVYFG